MNSSTPDAPLSYYGKPVIKEPVWKPEIPAYFFFGGLAGASSTLVPAARLAGNARLATSAKVASALAIGVSPLLLIKDLGRPQRFYNMLRVFKIRSPMSVGTWLLSAHGTCIGVAAATQLAGVLPRVRLAAETVAGLLGCPMSTYTGALVADSVVPAWHEARHELPALFAASSAAAAGGATAILTPAHLAWPARRLAIAGGIGEVVLAKLMVQRLGDLVGEAYKKGESGRYAKLAERCTLAGAALMALGGQRRVGAVAAGGLLLAGSWCQRFAVFHAGKTSAADPTYTTLPQRARAAERGQPAVTY
jgi:Polysulphide reductase, NrfD